jgi:ubiquinone/menaquinone biosynthesis C-methylase UbiE
MTDTLTQFAYQTLQQTKGAVGYFHKMAASEVMKQYANLFQIQLRPNVDHDVERESPNLDAAVINMVRQRWTAINQVDWQDAEDGVYPKSILFDLGAEDVLRQYPMVWLDMPKIWQRASKQQFREFDQSIDTTAFPNYYTQNFHFQTGGYLSDESADLYDLQVELLFNGGADPMRRRVLKPIKEGLAKFADVAPQHVQVLDIACGTGRTLKMLRGMLPQASLHGIDLSPAYLRKANALLSKISNNLPQLVQGPAESLPYRDQNFHAITCVFMFHELPGPVRQQIINEAFRVLKPGGTFVMCDSIQMNDSPDLAAIMKGFSKTFHEPFYNDYVQDDLVARLMQAGFSSVTEQVHYMSKYLIAHKAA